MLKPCAHETCGELSDSTYCDDHVPPRDDVFRRSKSRAGSGYDSAWDRLSVQARKLSPFCAWCNTTEDLTADHSPTAWKRKERGLPIRLQDIQVLCRSCNAKAGAARGGEVTREDFASAPPGRVPFANRFENGSQ